MKHKLYLDEMALKNFTKSSMFILIFQKKRIYLFALTYNSQRQTTSLSVHKDFCRGSFVSGRKQAHPGRYQDWPWAVEEIRRTENEHTLENRTISYRNLS